MKKLLFVIWMLLRRIASQWRLELCLFLGLLVATAVVTAVPLYTSGALQDSLIKEMKSYYSDRPPFTYSVRVSEGSYNNDKTLTRERFFKAVQYVEKAAIPARLRMQPICSGWSGALEDLLEIPNWQDSEALPVPLQVFTMTGFEPLVTFEEGRAPSTQAGPDGTVEMACAAVAADQWGLTVGNVYRMRCEVMGDKSVQKFSTMAGNEKKYTEVSFRLSGTFNLRMDRLSAPNWLMNPDFVKAVYITPGVFRNDLVQKRGVAVDGMELAWIMDYRQVRVQDLNRLTTTMNRMNQEFAGVDKAIAVQFTPLEVFNNFSQKQNALRLMLLTLAIPTLILEFYYVFLMAGLIVDGRRGEIAMLRSRGAGTLQLTAIFILEWTILAGGCLFTGPPLGLLLAQIVGASAGFLNFVNRGTLPVKMTTEAYVFGAAMAGLMIIAATVPAAQACRKTIIQYKQERSRYSSKPFWQRFYLDFLLLGVGVYGYRLLTLQAKAVDNAETASGSLVDPVLFLVPFLLVIAGGLLVVRALPLISGLLEKLTNRRRGVAGYSSLVEVSRNISQFRPLILLIILTTASGIYEAAMARTLEQNTKDRIYYKNGADVVLQEQWYRMIPDPPRGYKEDKDRPFEPPFLSHRELPGVLGAAQVQIHKGVGISSNNLQGQRMTVMAIVPWDFGHTAWFRPGLLPLPPSKYLNVLTRYPQAALVSGALMKNGILKMGDTLSVPLNGANVDLVVAGSVDYWPALYESEEPFLIVNLDYVTKQSSIQPYQVWLRMKPGAKLATVLKALQMKEIHVKSETDSRQELTLTRRDPERMGLYGILSIGFGISVLVTIMGYVLYTFFNLRKRLLQFGVMRAIGLSPGQLVGILGLEQLWSAGVGLILGTLIGQTVSVVFVPFLRTAAAMSGNIPPFQVVISNQDIVTIYGLFLPVFILGLTGLALTLAKGQINQAVKLGEEA